MRMPGSGSSALVYVPRDELVEAAGEILGIHAAIIKSAIDAIAPLGTSSSSRLRTGPGTRVWRIDS